MLLWHDDVRPPPDGWTWVRTNDQARELLQTGEVTAINLDHDLGYHTIDPETEDDYGIFRGTDEDNGLRLVEWMVHHRKVPDNVTIHSWNREGAKRMYLYLNEHGYDCEYEAYTP